MHIIVKGCDAVAASTQSPPRAPDARRRKQSARDYPTVAELLGLDTRRAASYSRTNVLINDQLLDEARQLTGLRTKKDIVEQALKSLVQLERQAKLIELQGLGWEGDLEEMRRGREFTIDQ